MSCEVYDIKENKWSFISSYRRKISLPKANTIHPPHTEKVQIFGGISWDDPLPGISFLFKFLKKQTI